jgi:hypothetical protein
VSLCIVWCCHADNIRFLPVNSVRREMLDATVLVVIAHVSIDCDDDEPTCAVLC